MGPDQFLQFRERRLIHMTARVGRTLSEGHGKNGSRFQQGQNFPKGPRAIFRGDMHPDSAYKSHIKGKTLTDKLVKTGKSIVDPKNPGIGMAFHTLLPHPEGRLHRHHLKPHVQETFGVPTRSGAHVQRRSSGFRQKGKKPFMNFRKIERLVAFRKYFRLIVISGNGTSGHTASVVILKSYDYRVRGFPV